MSQVIYMNNTKIAGMLRGAQLPANTKLTMNTGRWNREMLVSFALTGQLTSFDMEVADAVYTHYRAEILKGRIKLTASGLMRALCGAEKNAVTPRRREMLADSLRRMGQITFQMDCRDELEKRRETEGEGLISEPFLTLREEAGAFWLMKKPPLYRYAEMTRQMVNVPPLLLCGGETPGSWELIRLRRCLIRTLERIRNPNNSVTERSIPLLRSGRGVRKYEGLFAEAGVDRDRYDRADSWAHKRQKLTGSLGKIMDGYVRMGYVDRYELTRDLLTVETIADPWELPGPEGLKADQIE